MPTFKEGALAVIDRSTYRCSGCGGNHGQYFYGGSIKEVVPKSKGRIIKSSKDSLVLRLGNGLEIQMHPDEISILMSQRTPDSLEKIPQHPFFDMVSENAAVVLNDELYVAQGEPTVQRAVTLKGKTLGLSDPISLSSLDDLFYQRAEQELSAWRKDYAQELLSSTGANNLELGSEFTIPQRIYAEVFPYFRAERAKQKLGNILGAAPDVIQDISRSIDPEKERILETRAAQIRKDILEITKDPAQTEVQPIRRDRKKSFLDMILGNDAPTTAQSLIGRAINQNAVLFANSAAFDLSKVNRLNGTDHDVIVEGTHYRQGSQLDTNSLSRDYRKLLLEKQVGETLNVDLSESAIKSVLEEKFRNVPAFTGMRQYEEGDVGFLQSNRDWYVSLRVPAFAIKSPHDGRYYKFNSFKIGTNFERPEGVYTLEAVTHPFVGSKSGWGKVCFGDNGSVSGSTKGETIAKRLLLARDILTKGYNTSEIKPHIPLVVGSYRGNYYEDFKRNIRTKEQLVAEGVPIFGET